MHWSEHRRESIVVLGIIALFLGLGVFYALINPVYIKPDEVHHRSYVVSLLDGNGLPTVDPSKEGVNNHTSLEKEGHQPPLYYAFVAAVAKLFGSVDRVTPVANPFFLTSFSRNVSPWSPYYATFQDAALLFTGRLLSLLAGAATLVFSYLLLRCFVDWSLAALITIFLGFNPQFIFIATAFSNDMFGVMLVHLGLWLLARVWQHGLTLQRSVLIGLVIGLATLAKLGGLGLLAPLGLIALLQSWRTRQLRPLLYTTAAGAGLLGVAGWWFWRNWQLYRDPLTTSLLIPLMGTRPQPFAWNDLKNLLHFIWRSYWLDFSPGGILFAEEWIYWLIGGICLAGIWGSLLAFIRQPTLRPLFLLLVGWFLLVFVSLLQMTSRVAVFMGGGRLLFPAAVSGAVILGIGLWTLGRRHIWLPALVSGLLILYAVIAPGHYLTPRYPTPRIVSQLMQPPQITLNAIFGEQFFALLGYDLAIEPSRMASKPDRKADPAQLVITYYWQVLQPSDLNYTVFIQLLNPERNGLLAQLDTFPTYAAMPTSSWPTGQIVIDQLQIAIPSVEQPMISEVITGLYQYSNMERLSITSPQGTLLPNHALPVIKLNLQPNAAPSLISE